VQGSTGGTGSGRGGPGTPNGKGGAGSLGDATGEGNGEPTLYDPKGTNGETLNTGGSGNGESETVGKGNGQSGRGASFIPLSEALRRYQSQATAATDRGDLPPSLRALVRAYFDRLSGQGD
jgi:hypothetical protein